MNANSHVCPYCGDTFTRLVDMVKHAGSHVKNPNIPCPICPKLKFTSNDTLKAHIHREHTEREQEIYVWIDSGKGYPLATPPVPAPSLPATSAPALALPATSISGPSNITTLPTGLPTNTAPQQIARPGVLTRSQTRAQNRTINIAQQSVVPPPTAQPPAASSGNLLPTTNTFSITSGPAPASVPPTLTSQAPHRVVNESLRTVFDPDRPHGRKTVPANRTRFSPYPPRQFNAQRAVSRGGPTQSGDRETVLIHELLCPESSHHNLEVELTLLHRFLTQDLDDR